MNAKSGRAAVDPIRKEYFSRARSGVWNQPWLEGAQRSRLSSVENNVMDSVVTADMVAVAPTSHLVITKGVSNTMTLGAGELVIF